MYKRHLENSHQERIEESCIMMTVFFTSEREGVWLTSSLTIQAFNS